MAVTTFHDFPLAPRDREWDGAAAEKRVRAWADAQDKPNGKYRDAHIWYDAGSKQNFTAYKLLFTDIVNGRHVAVPRAIMAAGNIMQGSRGGIDLPESDITRLIPAPADRIGAGLFRARSRPACLLGPPSGLPADQVHGQALPRSQPANVPGGCRALRRGPCPPRRPVPRGSHRSHAGHGHRVWPR
jgi:hypothetical protein